MSSTFTTNLRLNKQGDGDNPNSWGQVLNDGVISLVDDAVAGYTTISVGTTANVTLTENQGSGDQARSAFLEVQGSVGGTHSAINILIPNNSKSYVVRNVVSYASAGADIILKVAGQTGVTIRPSENQFVITNGTDIFNVAPTEFSSLTVTGAATFGSTVTIAGNVHVSAKVCASAFHGDGSNLTGIITVPTGCIVPFAGTSAGTPSGFLLCHGQAVSRSTYSGLFSVITSIYGDGDGSSTFNLPDLRGRVIAGQDDMGGTSANRLTGQTGGVDGDTLGGSGGAETHTLTEAQLAAHTHGAGSYVINTGGDSAQNSTNGAVFRQDLTQTTPVSGSSGSTGSGSAHNIVQPTFILNYVIKT